MVLLHRNRGPLFVHENSKDCGCAPMLCTKAEAFKISAAGGDKYITESDDEP